MKPRHFKIFARKTLAFCIALLTFGLITGKSFAQTTLPDTSMRPTPNNPDQPSTIHNPYQKPDTSEKNMQLKSKLSPEQIKKIVGNDKPVGKDSQGRQLYEDANGGQYYINDSGTKVYVK